MSETLPRILIVDDDVGFAESLAAMLEAAGPYEVRMVHRAADAVVVATEFPPDIVFLDIELPDRSAYDVAKLLQQHADLRATRLIALTDSIEHPGREVARAAGFERYLVKPVTANKLLKVLRRRISLGDALRSVTNRESRAPGTR
ncbi:MAG TPA: response regulator [Steroidobacteraceae bacterium]|jgi:CheY-like chemotaxis protein|nr:response regulator [Steroidobacteraceae bacterium]